MMDNLNTETEGQEPQVTESESGGQDTSPSGQAEIGSPQDGGEQVVAGLPEGMTLETLPNAYKSLQKEYTKNQTAYKAMQESLKTYGGLEQVSQWMEYLAGNPRFAEWVQSEQQRAIVGKQGNDSELDDETKRAIEIVRRVANQEIQTAMKQNVEPLADKYKQRLIEENMSKMDSDPTYVGWREYQEVMAEIAEELPESIQDNPSLEDLQDLYWRAIRKSGKLNTVMAKSYQSMLQKKQKDATPRPGQTGGKDIQIVAKSMKEAFEQAKRQHQS